MGKNSQFYTNKNIKYIINKYIAEYDIKRAGLYALREIGAISDPTFNYWKNMNKLGVSKYIGKYLSEHAGKQNDKIMEIMTQFISVNNIQQQNIISQKRDAVFTFNTRPDHTQINGFEIVCKNEYTSYFNVENFELYYNGTTDVLDVKGIDTRYIQRHALLPHIKKCIKMYELLSAGFCTYADVYTYLYRLRKQYVTYELPIGCYREIAYNNPYCMYHIPTDTVSYFDGVPTESKSEYRLIANFNFTRFIVPFINILPSFKPVGVAHAQGKSYGSR